MELLQSIFLLILTLLNPISLIPIVIIVIIFVKKNKEYKECAYYQVTKLPYLSVRRNTGRYGEYLTYKYLKHLETTGAKFLFNLYIPKDNGETTEIDVLMIDSKGIYVFESKNYSGWIFGSESQRNWYQTLPAGRGSSHKERFYNPVMQNRTHIKHLQALLGEKITMHSIIVFSDRCTLKNVQIDSKNISVINRYNVNHAISAIYDRTPIDILDTNRITEIFSKLYPFTQVDEATKAQHIENIHNSLGNRTIEQPQPASVSQIRSVDSVAVNGQEFLVDMTEPKQMEPKAPQVPKCPQCNGNLILRTATRGANAGNQFFGCSNYPKCRYIQNIPNDTEAITQ